VVSVRPLLNIIGDKNFPGMSLTKLKVVECVLETTVYSLFAVIQSKGWGVCSPDLCTLRENKQLGGSLGLIKGSDLEPWKLDSGDPFKRLPTYEFIGIKRELGGHSEGLQISRRI
jgi:hypothetical protein